MSSRCSGVDDSLAPEFGNRVTEGRLAASIFQLFIPALMSLSGAAWISIVDIYLAGWLGHAEQAAIGLADQVLFLVTMVGAGLATACTAHVAKWTGAREHTLSKFYARDGILLALVVGLLSSIGCWGFGKDIIALFHSDPHTSALAVRYTVANAPANMAYMVSICLVAIFRASGRPNLGLLVWFAMSVASTGLSVMFFAGGPSQLRSLEGLGWAWVIGSFVGMSIGVIGFFKEETQLRRALLFDYSGSSGRVVELLRTAAPAMAAEVALIGSNLGVFRLLSDLPMGCSAQAAWTIKMKLEETFATMPLTALSMAVAVVVGQNLGAKRMERAGLSSILACTWGVGIMILVGGLMTVLAKPVVHIFSNDASTSQLAVALLSPSSMIMPAMALSQVLCGALDGAALTRASLCVQAIGMLLVRLGLTGWLISCGHGIDGLAWATVASAICCALCALFCYARYFPAVVKPWPWRAADTIEQTV